MNIIKEPEFENCPTGTTLAICYLIADVGIQPSDQYEEARKIVVAWELPNELMRDGVRPFAISAIYTATLGKKSNLRHALETWRGREFTPEELRGFEFKRVLGTACMINVVLTDRGRNKVGSIVPLPKGMTVPQLSNKLVYYDIDEPDNEESYKQLPEWIQKMVDKAIRNVGEEVNEPAPF